MATRAVVMIRPATRDAVQKCIKQTGLKADDFVFPSRIHDSLHLRTRKCARSLEGDPKLESTVRYLGIEVDDALEISEQTEI